MNPSTFSRFPHYYGDTVRWLFMIVAVIMVLTLPVFNSVLKIPTTLSIVCILVLGFAAGFTNPKLLWGASINAIICTIGFLLFETIAVQAYRQHSSSLQAEIFFFTNLGIGLLFLVAIYYSVKTLRGLVLGGEPDNQVARPKVRL